MKAITPTTIHFAEKTLEAMCAYEESIQQMDSDFRADKCFTLECGSEDAFKLLDKYAKDFEKELKVLEHNANLCAVFEFPEKIDVVRSPRFELVSIARCRGRFFVEFEMLRAGARRARDDDPVD